MRLSFGSKSSSSPSGGEGDSAEKATDNEDQSTNRRPSLLSSFGSFGSRVMSPTVSDSSPNVDVIESTSYESSVNPAAVRSNSMSSKLSAFGGGIGKGIQSFGTAFTSGVSEIANGGRGSTSSKFSPINNDTNIADNETSSLSSHQVKLNQIEKILDTLRLQVPTSSTGVAVVYSSASTAFAPLDGQSLGILFTWYRIAKTSGADSSTTSCSSDEPIQLQSSTSPMYLPTADDINQFLCLQCSDNMNEGYTKYIEAEIPIRADTLLRSISESALLYGLYSCKEVQISIGLQGQNISLSHNIMITVDRQGELLHSEPAGGASVTPDTNDTDMNPSTAIADTHNHIHGLQILSKHIRNVKCASPCSIIISIAVHKYAPKTDGEQSEGKVDVNKSNENSKTNAEEFSEASFPLQHISLMWNTATSHIERCEDSEPSSSILRNDNFQDVLLKLNDCKAMLSSDATVLELYITCKDRTERDVLVLSIRGLDQSTADDDRDTVLHSLPWNTSVTAIEEQAYSPNESSIEILKRLHHIENENNVLKNNLQNNNGTYTGQSDISKKEINSLQNELATLRSERLVAEGELEVRERRVAQLRSENETYVLTIKSLEANEIKFKKLYQESSYELTNASKELIGLQSEHSVLQTEHMELKDKISSLETSQEEFTRKKLELTNKLKTVEENCVVNSDVAEHAVAHVKELETQLFDIMAAKIKQDSEITVLKTRLQEKDNITEECNNAKNDAINARSEAENAIAQVNHEKKKSDGASKELKKVMKENSVALFEFERALLRKTEECNMLYDKLDIMKNDIDKYNEKQSQTNGGAMLTSASEMMPNPTAVATSVSQGMKRFGSITAGTVTSVFGKRNPSISDTASATFGSDATVGSEEGK